MKRMHNKAYRTRFTNDFQTTRLSAQLVAMRKARKLSQAELGARLRMGQSRISELEGGDYSRWSLATLRRIASFFDVALLVHFDTFTNAEGSIETVQSAPESGYRPRWDTTWVHEDATAGAFAIRDPNQPENKVLNVVPQAEIEV